MAAEAGGCVDGVAVWISPAASYHLKASVPAALGTLAAVMVSEPVKFAAGVNSKV